MVSKNTPALFESNSLQFITKTGIAVLQDFKIFVTVI